MRQVWMTRHGGPEVFEVREIPDPQPGPGQVRIRVQAAGVNFADILIRVGLYPDAPKLPAVIGYEVAGIIDATGDGAAGQIGERVVALLPRYGGYSDCMLVPAAEAVPIPEGISVEAAAAVPVNYMTAWLMLVELAHLEPEQWVLIHSAAGGVGLAAVQICRWRGAQVIGTASPSKHERLQQAGVRHCIDSGTADFASQVLRHTGGRGVDVALDALGGKALAGSYQCLAPLGRLFTFGVSRMVSGRRRNWVRVVKEWLTTPRFNPLDLLQTSRGVMGVTLGSLKDDPQRQRDILERVLDLVAAGSFQPQVDSVFELERAADAHIRLQARMNYGKVLLIPRH